ncbi:MAG: hypothetical protein EXS25_01865 [Pedosphaera sp.]|nr:hypothetical protein [Pedosphaera sp.]
MSDLHKSGNKRPRIRWALPFSLGAWFPFTGSGVARFANAPIWRTLCVLALFASFTASSLVQALQTVAWPVLLRAAKSFPESSVSLSAGQLNWGSDTSQLLADSPQFGIAFLGTNAPPIGRTADLQIELTPNDLRFAGIAGSVRFPWPSTLKLSTTRRETVAACEAWYSPLLVMLWFATAFLGAVIGIISAVLIAPLVWLLTTLLRRQISLGGSWKLGIAATPVGHLTLSTALLTYSLRFLSWPALLVAIACHIVLVWVWTLWAVFHCPIPQKNTEKQPLTNPFQPSTSAQSTMPSKKKRNPFGFR